MLKLNEAANLLIERFKVRFTHMRVLSMTYVIKFARIDYA